VKSTRQLDAAQSKEILASLGVTLGPAPGPGLEIVLGAHRDLQFGPIVTFALGGVIGEALNDTAVRLAPLSAADAGAMLDEMRGRRLLDGENGRPAADRAAVQESLVRLSDLMLQRSDIARIAIEPAFAHASGLSATDARIELTGD
jgi:hypothetical protein